MLLNLPLSLWCLDNSPSNALGMQGNGVRLPSTGLHSYLNWVIA